MSQAPVVRIAPSPSGYLHVGTARTAIFNYLFARHNNGKFLVRIEDTDKERSNSELVEPILDALRWLGITWDADIVFQSQRIAVHTAYAKQILNSDYAYPCFCTAAELEQKRNEAMANKRAPRYDRKCLNLSKAEVEQKLASGVSYAIRLRIPEGETGFHDMVSGELKLKNEDIEDFIIARSDGTAVYNLAVVADDHEMGVTHVIRGNDHITNTFKQIHIYRALNWPIPEFGHVPLILRPDKKKVSKRLGDKDVNQYALEGILPEAMFNYLCLLGWSPKTDREIYSFDELVHIFTPNNLNPANAVFDEEKLIAFNKEHIQLKPLADLAKVVAPLMVSAGVVTEQELKQRWSYFEAMVGLLRERVRRLTDYVNLGKFFFHFDGEYDPAAQEKQFTAERAVLLGAFADRLEQMNSFDQAALEQALEQLTTERGVKKAELIHPTRLAVSGISVGPGLYAMLELLGKEIVVARLRQAVKYIGAPKAV